ncbi:hypothetical protein [Clostridium massiliamazoniense]|uniref:hypothetical protein n=1 Tax=Clostridium massiliamazoniense TaxID=1347366 RepID=UPI0006D85366|nr:hypothetical protein [Clostridium massiliamazoniense]
MSEPIYETPNEVPSILNRGTGIISYLIGSPVATYSNDLNNLFQTNQSFDCLMAFTKNHLILGSLNNGNNSTDELSIPYSSIKHFNYYEKSRKLEIVSKENKKFLIKVSKDILNSSLKNLNYDFKINYKKENHSIIEKLKPSAIILLGTLLTLGLLYKIFL